MRQTIWEVDTEGGSFHQLPPTTDSTWLVMTDALSSLTTFQTHQLIQLPSLMIYQMVGPLKETITDQTKIKSRDGIR